MSFIDVEFSLVCFFSNSHANQLFSLFRGGITFSFSFFFSLSFSVLMLLSLNESRDDNKIFGRRDFEIQI